MEDHETGGNARVQASQRSPRQRRLGLPSLLDEQRGALHRRVLDIDQISFERKVRQTRFGDIYSDLDF